MGRRLRAALAEWHAVPFEEVAVGAGSDGLVDCLSQAVLDPGDTVMLLDPTNDAPTRTRRRIDTDGTKERLSVKSGEAIPRVR